MSTAPTLESESAPPAPVAPQGRRTVFVLTLAQAFAMTGVSIVTLSTGLAGTYLAIDPALATLPLAAQFGATMCATFAAAMIMRRIGRRAGFTLGQAIGVAGALVSAWALRENSFVLFLAGGVLLGVHNAFWGFYRFAAAEAADDAFRAKAISLVMAGGVISAVLGPELAKATRDLLAPISFAGCYVAIAALCALNIALLQMARLPPPPTDAERRDSGRPLVQIMRQPAFVAAVLAAMVGYGVMILVMAATPISMVDCGLTFDDAALVIQWHALAMFAPSFFTGSLIKRFGTRDIVIAGLVLNAACMAIHLAGTDFANFWFGLVALGLGWNFVYVGATTLLTESYHPAEKDKAQAANDTLVFAAITVATFASGALQNTIGWQAVNLAIALPVLVAFLGVIAAGRHARSAAYR
ncbi:MAG: MFS transporter [Rhodospirillaceae bacterium]|nr:MFS transporter [Rhodospirillaceae bacterium]